MRRNTRLKMEPTVTCIICKQRFIDPRILPCSHTYCLHCIQDNISINRDQFQCPIDDEITISRHMIDSLPKNETMNSVIEYLSKSMNSSTFLLLFFL